MRFWVFYLCGFFHCLSALVSLFFLVDSNRRLKCWWGMLQQHHHYIIVNSAFLPGFPFKCRIRKFRQWFSPIEVSPDNVRIGRGCSKRSRTIIIWGPVSVSEDVRLGQWGCSEWYLHKYNRKQQIAESLLFNRNRKTQKFNIEIFAILKNK